MTQTMQIRKARTSMTSENEYDLYIDIYGKTNVGKSTIARDLVRSFANMPKVVFVNTLRGMSPTKSYRIKLIDDETVVLEHPMDGDVVKVLITVGEPQPTRK